jgi:hypothetical protein
LIEIGRLCEERRKVWADRDLDIDDRHRRTAVIAQNIEKLWDLVRREAGSPNTLPKVLLNQEPGESPRARCRKRKRQLLHFPDDKLPEGALETDDYLGLERTDRAAAQHAMRERVDASAGRIFEECKGHSERGSTRG